MSENLNILLVDDNEQQSQLLKNYLCTKDHIGKTDMALSVGEALIKLQRDKYDAIILDLIMPENDGIALLDAIRKLDFETKPMSIVLSSLFSESVITNTVNHGAKYFFAKPMNAETLYKRLLDMFSLSNVMYDNEQIIPTVRSKSLDERITSIFLSIGIPAHIKGYQFLREAVKIVVKTPDTINSITKQLYPGIAQNFDTSASKVERAIRHAIEVAWARGRLEHLNDIFGYNIYEKNDKPTNGEFIALIADKISMDIRN